MNIPIVIKMSFKNTIVIYIIKNNDKNDGALS